MHHSYFAVFILIHVIITGKHLEHFLRCNLSKTVNRVSLLGTAAVLTSFLESKIPIT